MQFKKILLLVGIWAAAGISSAATFYEHSHGRGDRFTEFAPGYRINNHDLDGLGDEISSVRVIDAAGQEECVIVAEHASFGGKWIELGPRSTPHGVNPLNDRVSSVMVYRKDPAKACGNDDVATMHKHGGLNGRKFPLAPDVSVSGFNDYNDDASSLYVPPGLCVELYRDVGFRGTKKVFGPGVYALREYDFNDAASSARAYKGDCQEPVSEKVDSPPDQDPPSTSGVCTTPDCYTIRNSCLDYGGSFSMKPIIFNVHQYYCDY